MRRVVALTLGLIVVIAAASALWNYVRSEGPAPQLVVEDVGGTVWTTRAAPSEDAQLAPGSVLFPNDDVRTGDDGRVVLSLGQSTRIRLGTTSSITVRAIDEDGVHLELEDGLLEAVVRPEGGAVRIGNRGREVVATNADFRMGARGEVVQVEAMRGEVALSGADHTRVAAGEQATVIGREATVQPVPEDLLLEVAWPDATRTRERITTVSGTTAPLAVVLLRGNFPEVRVQADALGHFTAQVSLKEGGNVVDVVAVDALGQESPVRQGRLQIRDTVGPSYRGGVEYGD